MNHQPELTYKRLIVLFLGINVLEIFIYFLMGKVGGIFKDIGFEKITPYFKVISTVLVLYVLLEWFCRKRGFRLSVTYFPKANEVFALFSLLLGYNLIYGNTVGFLLTNVKEAAWMIEAIHKLLEYPIILVLEVVILAPLIEEIVYRGIFLEYLAQKYGNPKALFITSLLFGIIHLNWHQGVYAFFAGLMMGWIYLRTRNLLHTIAIHMIQNGIGVSVMLMFKDLPAETDVGGFNLGTILFGALLFWFGYLFMRNYKSDSYKHFDLNEWWKRYVIDNMRIELE